MPCPPKHTHTKHFENESDRVLLRRYKVMREEYRVVLRSILEDT